MTHDEAQRSQAAEQYLLGELSAAGREEYEQHFFGCPECAEEVRTGAIFIANARAVFAEEPRRAAGRWRRLRQPAVAAPLAASVALALLAAWLLAIVIPGLRHELVLATAPQAYPAVFLRAVSRGGDQVIEISGASRFVGLSLDVPPGRAWREYTCELRDGSGALRASLPVAAAPRAGSSLHLLLPGSSFSSGSYTLVLRGHDGGAWVELNRYRFTIQLN